MSDQYAALRSNVGLLGQMLGQTIAQALGDSALAKVESIRQLAKTSRGGDEQAREALISELQSLSDDELLLVVRAFNQFLNLANVAEQYHTVSRSGNQGFCELDPLKQTLLRLKQSHVQEHTIKEAIARLDINLVLTAHPTEVTRRTLINKHVQLSDCLNLLELGDLLPQEQQKLHARMRQLIAQAWHTDEIRQQRPTPLDEAKWGYAVIENSLWQAVPEYVRELDDTLTQELGVGLASDAKPVRFTSWMGGDRDGNPFVTSSVTQSVLDHGRWMALDLYIKDINLLISELSMFACDAALAKQAEGAHEPYRAVLKQLREKLTLTHEYLEAKITGQSPRGENIITDISQITDVLKACERSLEANNMAIIAQGQLRDTLIRCRCFGLQLSQLDIRQDSDRHAQVLGELTEYLGLGDYCQWDEQGKQEFLKAELASKRPLLPRNWQPSEQSQEVLDTFKVIAQNRAENFGIYIISMARQASDVLAVKLLLQEAGCQFNMPVAPLFETLDDLNRAPEVMQALYSDDVYRQHLGTHQYVMIGYSDSAKDAGMMAAGWAQYSAMESLVQLSEEQGVELVLFHGRGGTVGRGGAPAAQALRSQPPGSLKNGLRVTEQGEMIRFKFGLASVAKQSLHLYASAVLEGNLLPPPEPEPKWRDVMAKISDASCQHYRATVRENPEFVPYFRSATPEQELGKLPLGSRPSKRNPNGGVESLRAIPWIFAWSQNRLMLPAWLGAYQGLGAAISEYGEHTLQLMSQQWPFFRTRLEMLEMVFCKADSWLSAHYDQHLVAPQLQHFGERLRQELAQSVALIKELSPEHTLLGHQPWVRESIALRNPYTDPLNVLQVELLKRARTNSSQALDKALMVTMAGIAAGMRNTG
ncbi:phosphoenolpyruvate carboxylase [Pseudoalteromonas ruthenica]|uniref:phosphoenolpyruvate carboxylase n=1 Tax=Pseudoalteromonas ruthenica TaxID=151081 RepID=UPI001109F2E6|nr:phosphoenolpyruvate carboxylase [Pseudoalteromonas ruthenica]TLX50033.1 phosphoenolpyruvate carboxylase [Pseudoalteromonas ruthenica]